MNKPNKGIAPFRVYKPTKTGGGAASYWRLSVYKQCVWLEVAAQTGTMEENRANFDWENKLRFKCGLSDLGDILAVLTGVKESVGPVNTGSQENRGLFHQTPKGNSVLRLISRDDGFYMKLSVRNGETDEVRSQAHNITPGEAEILRVLVEAGLILIYKWTEEGAQSEMSYQKST